MPPRNHRIKRLAIALIAVYSTLSLVGCGTMTGIPSHGGGKRYSQEQRLVSASIRSALKDIDVTPLRGHKVAIVFDIIADEGGGTLSGGRLNIVGAAAAGYLAGPVTATTGAFQVFNLADSGSSYANSGTQGSGSASTTYINSGTGTQNGTYSQTGTGSNTQTTNVNAANSNTGSTAYNQTGTGTATSTGNGTNANNGSSSFNQTSAGSNSGSTAMNGTTANTGVTDTVAATPTSSNTATSTNSGSFNQTQTATGTNTGSTTGSNTTAATGSFNQTQATNSSNAATGSSTSNNAGTSTQTATSNGTNTNATTSNNTATTASAQNGNSNTGNTYNQTGNQTGGYTATRQAISQAPSSTTSQAKGMTATRNATIDYKGLGEYQNFNVPKSDASLLMGLVRNYLMYSGVQVTTPTDPSADILLYVTVDVFGITRSRFDSYVYNNEKLKAETSFEMAAFDRSGRMVMGVRNSDREAQYAEHYLLWAGPFVSTERVRKGDGLLVDFSDVDGLHKSYGKDEIKREFPMGKN